MRVVLFVTDLERGGAPLRLAHLARGLRERGVDVRVGCLAPPGPVSAALGRGGISTFACAARGPRDWFALARFRKHLRDIRPDLIHATLTHANVAARFVGRWIGIPVLSSTATIEVERPWHVRLERLTGRLDRGHLVNSSALAAHVERAFRIPRERIHIVPPLVRPLGPPLDRSKSRARFEVPEDAFVVAWAGRFDPVKRLEILIACAEQLGVEGPIHFVLAGEGKIATSISERVAGSVARDRIHLPGWLDDLSPLFSAADVFVLPSLSEGMPNVALQAMGIGLPVIAADIPALAELAGDGERAVLVNGADARAYAEALRRLRDDPAAAQRVAQAGAAWVRQACSPAESIAATLRVYERVLGSSFVVT